MLKYPVSSSPYRLTGDQILNIIRTQYLVNMTKLVKDSHKNYRLIKIYILLYKKKTLNVLGFLLNRYRVDIYDDLKGGVN